MHTNSEPTNGPPAGANSLAATLDMHFSTKFAGILHESIALLHSKVLFLAFTHQQRQYCH